MPTQSDLLTELADIHLPSGVSWWPLAPGWWVVISLFIIAAIAIYFWRRHQQRNRYRQFALQELHRVYQDAQQQSSSAIYLQHVSSILRRTAMSAYPDSFNNSIKGDDWLQWLDAHCRLSADSFAAGSGRALLIGPYQKSPQVDINALHQLSSYWAQHHRNQWQKNKQITVKNAEATHV